MAIGSMKVAVDAPGRGVLHSFMSAGNGLWSLLLAALLLRLFFFQPYYLPPDALDYLNSWDGLTAGYAPDIIRFVRLGMTLPMILLGWLGGGNHLIYYLYIFTTSLGTVWLCHRLALQWGDRQAALLAGALIALVPMEVVYGSVLLPDVPLSFFALCAFYLTGKAAERERGGPLLTFAAGIFIGLAYACKVTGLFFLPSATVQAFWQRRRLLPALALVAGVGLVIAGEILVLRLWLDEWHVRIAETLGYALGSKGNYAHVDRTLGWWLGQIGFKLGAMFWGAHLPTTALILVVPHLVLWALWRSRRVVLPAGSWWLLAWGGVYVGQQLLLSTIEQEPRLLQAALPYCAVLIGLVFASDWQGWHWGWRWAIGVVATGLAFVGSVAFWGTHAPSAGAVQSLLAEFKGLAKSGEKAVVDSPSDYIHRLAYYGGLQTTKWNPAAGPITHWAFIHNGYTAKSDPVSAPADMRMQLDAKIKSPIRPVYGWLEFLPGVGDASRAVLYRRPQATPADP